MLLLRKEISILISAVFIITLISSTPVQSVRVSGAENQDFLYSVSVTPAFVKVQQGEFGTFDVKIQRGSDVGSFFVDLSLYGESTVPRGVATFNPPTLNFEQGQVTANSTLKINSHGLDTGSFRFRVEAVTHIPVGSDQAVSNPAALIVGARSDSLTASQSDSSAPADASAAQSEENNKELSESMPTQPNHAPIAKAGQDQTINEGERSILDGSASSDPDKDALSFSWEQLVPRQPTIKLVASEALGKASFIAPDVDRDTLFRFNLVLQDGNGGQAADSVNILVKDVVAAAAREGQQEQQQQQQQQQQEEQQNQELASNTPSSDSVRTGATTDGGALASAENHSPTAEALQTIFANDGNPLSIALKGNDPDTDDSISFAIVSEPSRGTIAGFDKATGSLTYVPASDFSSQDRFSFKVTDSHGSESNVGVVVIRASASSQSTTSPTSPSSSTPSESSTTNSNATAPSTAGNNASTAGTDSAAVTDSKSNQDDNNNIISNNTAPSTPSTNITASAELPTGNASLQNETMSSFAASSVAAGEVYRFVKDCTGSGTPFSSPHAVDVDSSGNLYVLDTSNNRVQLFDADCNFIRQWGSAGSGNGQFNAPQGISVSPSGNAYVVDTGNNRVQKFTPTGGFLLSWGAKGSGNGQFDTPVEIDHDSLGNSYVADANNKRIVKSLDGQFKAKWSGAGQGQGQMKGPHGIAVDGANFVYVTDNVNNNLLKFTNTGGHVKTVSGLNSPHGVTADSEDSIFVAERGANKVKKFDGDLNFLTEFGSGPGSIPGVFNGPDGITVSSSGKVYVTDTGNNKVQLWRPAPTISVTADTTQPKWDHEVKVTATAANFDSTDKAVFEWGDGTPSTEVSPIPQSGTFEVTHVYGIDSVSTNPNNIVGKIQSSDGVELATSQPIAITVQKHSTSLTLEMRPNEQPHCANCPFYVIGKLVDSDSTPPNKEIGGKTISLSGSGASSLANPVQTHGLIFSGTPSENLTLTSSELQMPAGSEISLPAGSHGVVYKFKGDVGITLTKGNDLTVNLNVPGGSVQNADFLEGLKKITISSGPAELEAIAVRDFAVDGTDEHQIAVDFTQNVAAPGSYPTLSTSQGVYLSGGITQNQDGSGLKITASFDGANDLAYLGAASPELSYDVSLTAGVGEGVATAYSGTVWTKLTVGTATAGDACTVNGVASLDADKDGICDRWEDAATSGNDATHRYIVCPTAAGPVAIDPLCANTNGSIKYDLCFADAFASVWGNKNNGDRICPTKGHKDIYVEIDYMQNHLPSTTAIRNVIKAFGNAPITGQTADAFSRTQGITLHVVVSDQFARSAPFNVWTDGTPSLNDFRGAKETNFGTAAERAGTSGMPGMTAAAWTSTGKIMKHYVYHYGQWITYYGGACTASGLSSGLAELLGNDFIVSLGCGFGGTDPAGGSVGTDDEQAGTFMHELGHNLNLAHGGAATLAIGSSNYNMNCKPNYLSVMNYPRQMPNAVLDAASWQAAFNYGGAGAQTSLDYGRSTILDFPENAAPETTNIVSSDGKQYWIVYGTPTKSPAVRKVLSGTTIDFDGSGAKAGSVTVDLNVLSPTVAGCGPIGNPSTFPNAPDTPQTLKSYSDWDKINLVFTPDGDSQDGVTQRVSQPFINKNTQELKPVFLQSIEDDIKLEFIPPPAPDGSSTFNTGQTVPLKFRLLDKDDNFITNAVVTLVAEKGATIITGSTPFAFNPSTNVYQYDWSTPSGGAARGEWTLKYVMNLSTNPSVIPGPFATGQYTLKVTGVK